MNQMFNLLILLIIHMGLKIKHGTSR